MVWRASGLPEIRGELVSIITWMLDDGGIRYKLRAIEEYLASGQPQLEHTDEMLREMRALDAHPARLRHAELYWVTAPMAELALDASTDLPTFVPSATMPALAGVIAFAGGLPPLPTSYGDHVLVDCGLLTWVIVDGELVVTAWGSTTAAPASLGLDDWSRKWFEVLMVAIPVGAAVTDEAFDDDDARSLIYLLGATWILMQMPTVAECHTAVQHGKKARRIAKEALRSDVVLIDLRRLQNVGSAEPGDGEARTFHHRWMVRGHWRQQRKGPGLSEVEPRWIKSHVKGPDGAPYLARDHVHVWRR